MTSCSVTVTYGSGSETHNHDAIYRSTLSHVHACEEGLVELIPCRDYAEQINGIMRPYIDRYNAQVEERYQAAMARYEAGNRRSKPRRGDYKPMDYDYASGHMYVRRYNRLSGKIEDTSIVKSLIIGLGDREDRLAGRISRDQAIAIFQELLPLLREKFPNFYFLGYVLHLDETGFFHVHLEWICITERENWTQGLPVNLGLDTALAHMGFDAEMSIINAEDKPPLLFNALRNTIYRIMEQVMAHHGLQLQYGVTRLKHPVKDPSRHQRLDVWQAEQDRYRKLQAYKNLVLDTLDQPDMAVTDLASAAAIIDNIRDIVEGRQPVHALVLCKGYEVTSELLDRFLAATQYVMDAKLDAIREAQSQLDAIASRVQDYRAEVAELRQCEVTLTHNVKTLAALSKQLQEANQKSLTEPAPEQPKVTGPCTMAEYQAQIRARRASDAQKSSGRTPNTRGGR